MSRSTGVFAGLAACLLWAGTALADPSPSDRATARSLASEGYQALQDKDYATAVDRFSRADSLVHAPTLTIDWARSLVGLGKLVEAQERYEQIIREGVDAKAPRSWQRALSDANAELAELKPRLAWLTVSVAGSDEPDVTIDDVPVPVAAIGVRRAVNPGSLSVRAQAEGFEPQTTRVELAEGATSAVDFKLVPIPQSKRAVALPSRTPVKRRDPTWMYASFAVAGTGLVVGSVSGLLWLHKRSELKLVCRGSRCAPSHGDDVDSYHAYGTTSVASFAVGLAGAGAGLALWWFNRPAAPSHSRASNGTTSGMAVYPFLGPTSVGAVGHF